VTQLRNLGGLPDKGSRTAGRKAPNYLTRSGGDCPEASRESNGSLLEAAEDKNQQFLYIREVTQLIYSFLQSLGRLKHCGGIL
jgi:hypothetical protein